MRDTGKQDPQKDPRLFKKVGDLYTRSLEMANAYGTLRKRRVHGCLVHIDLIDGNIWIQRDGTEEGIAADLEGLEFLKSILYLGFIHQR